MPAVDPRRDGQGPDLAIEVRDLAKHYGATHALDGVDLEVPQGGVVGLLGPNGAGKTTLVRVLTTLLQPTSGTARVFGLDVTREATAIREVISLTGQYAAVDELLTGRENLLMFAELLQLTPRSARRRADELLERFDLTDAAERRASTYSGGMRRRLDLASSVIVPPRLLFLDEPTTGLDPRTRNQMWDVIRELVEADTTILLTTQYLEEADQLADRIVVIDKGRELAQGTADELKAQVGGERIEVRVDDSGDLAAARDVLARAAVGEVEVNEGTLTLLAPISGGPPVLRGVLRDLEEAGVEVTDVGLRRPTLDDVFFALTGHGAEEAERDGPDDDGRRRPDPDETAEVAS